MSIHLDDRSPQAPPTALPHVHTPRFTDGRIVAAIALIAIGVLALIGTFADSRVFGLSFLPMLGLIFLAWGLLARIPGLLIPGGILTGLGAGVLLTDQIFATASEDFRGGTVVLGLALGFAVIVPLARLVAHEMHWWPLVVGGVLTVIGATLMIGGPAVAVLTVVGRAWPVLLIAFGAYLLWQGARKR